ncbi:MAG TPA: carboxypeptidase-like regulatory domain-containing protein [Chitinophagaceae bacterium]|nr:carboxypeptidase-like regulatory domain-containing protein [Chitinophagaceae bacterium]
MIKIMCVGATLFLTVSAASQIQGDVVGNNDKGVPNAIIIATDSIRNAADTVKSDSRGFYQFKGLKPGKYKIVAKAAGFRTAVYENVEVKEGDTGAVEGEEDYYRGQRLDVFLTPAKAPK